MIPLDPKETAVVFRAWKDNGAVFAMSPEVNGDMDDERICAGWLASGFWAPFNYANEMRLSRKATEGEYSKLLGKIKDAGIKPAVVERAPDGSAAKRRRAIDALWAKKCQVREKIQLGEAERLERWNAAAREASAR